MSVLSIIRPLTISLCSLNLVNCSIFKSTEISQAAWIAGAPEVSFRQGPQACAVLESFLNAETISDLSSDPFENDAIDTSFTFYGRHAWTNTDCAFTDGTTMTWQEMRKKKISRVCFRPDYSKATLLMALDFSSFEKVYFKTIDDRWELIGKTAYDLVLVDGGVELAQREYRENSFLCF